MAPVHAGTKQGAPPSAATAAGLGSPPPPSANGNGAAPPAPGGFAGPRTKSGWMHLLESLSAPPAPPAAAAAAQPLSPGGAAVPATAAATPGAGGGAGMEVEGAAGALQTPGAAEAELREGPRDMASVRDSILSRLRNF